MQMGCPAHGKEGSFLLDSLYQRGVDCVLCLFPLFIVLSFAASLHNPQPLVCVPQTGRILPGTVGETLSQPCHTLRVTLQSLLICQYRHSELWGFHGQHAQELDRLRKAVNARWYYDFHEIGGQKEDIESLLSKVQIWIPTGKVSVKDQNHLSFLGAM